MLRDQEIVYVGNDWFADNRTSSHQIARLLAQHNRMLYVEAAGQRAPTTSKRDLAKIVARLKKVWSAPVRVDPNVHVFSPLIIPLTARPIPSRSPAMTSGRAAGRMISKKS